MENRFLAGAAIVAGAVLIPLALWRIVGARRQRDPLLLPLGIIATAFVVGGFGELVVEGRTWRLILGALGLVGFAIRWRKLSPGRTSTEPQDERR